MVKPSLQLPRTPNKNNIHLLAALKELKYDNPNGCFLIKLNGTCVRPTLVEFMR